MKIAVVGCGAMGSVYAALLADAGNEVVGITTNKAHVAAINASGLRVSGASGDRVARIRAVTAIPAEKFDHVVVALKALQIPAIADQLLGILNADASVLALQNGLGSAEVLAKAVGEERLAVGIAGGFGASLPEPGHAYHNGMAMIKMGAYGSLPRAAVDVIVAVWAKAGFTVAAADDILAMQWEKLICNVTYSALCALTGLTIGQVLNDPEVGPLSRDAAEEAWRIGRARGANIAFPDPKTFVREFGERMPDAKPSMLQDHERKKPSEIDFINGAIVREAAKAGLEAPVNATLSALVKRIDKTF